MRFGRNLPRLFTGAAVGILLAGCTHTPPPAPPPPPPAPDPDPVPARGRIEADSVVSISRNANGGYDFRYSGAEVDPKGNFDLAGGPSQGNEVLLRFCLSDGDYERGIRFMSPGSEAIWIELSEFLEPGESPQGPYQGEQFHGFATIMNARCAQVVDVNDDGLMYTYALRFRIPGEKNPVPHDPIIRNGN